MLETAEKVSFVPSTDLQAARRFYEGVLGLRVVELSPYALVLPGVRVTLVDAFTPQPFTVLGWAVPDIRATLAELTTRGVTALRYSGMTQSAEGIWTTPNGDQIAWFHDPAGNTLSLTQHAHEVPKGI